VSKISDCCGSYDKIIGDDGPSWSDVELCPNCRDHCTWVEEPREARIVTIHMLIDVDNDADAADWLSEGLRQNPDVLDWGYVKIPVDPQTMEYSKPYEYREDEYREGQFIDEMTREKANEATDPNGTIPTNVPDTT
jgi:hypothetical protein